MASPCQQNPVLGRHHVLHMPRSGQRLLVHLERCVKLLEMLVTVPETADTTDWKLSMAEHAKRTGAAGGSTVAAALFVAPLDGPWMAVDC